MDMSKSVWWDPIEKGDVAAVRALLDRQAFKFNEARGSPLRCCGCADEWRRCWRRRQACRIADMGGALTLLAQDVSDGRRGGCGRRADAVGAEGM